MKLKRAEFEHCTETACALLARSVHKAEGKCGWHQQLGSNKIGNVASSQGLLALSYFKHSIDEKANIINTLAENQKADANPAINGGWTFVTNGYNQPTTEATSWALLALLRFSERKTAVDKGLKWLINNCVDDSGRKAWSSTRHGTARVYPTTLALRVFAAHGKRNDLTSSAISWLLTIQNSDGGWGEAKDKGSTVIHTSHVVIALTNLAPNANQEAITLATNWLLSKFCPVKLWHHENARELLEEFEVLKSVEGRVVSDGRVTLYHCPTPWAITALIEGQQIFERVVSLGIAWILKSSVNGLWQHPHLQGSDKKPLWAIHDCLLALATFKKSFPYFNRIQVIHFSTNRITLALPRQRKSKVSVRAVLQFISRYRWILFSVGAAVDLACYLLGYLAVAVALWPFVGGVIINLLTPEFKADKAV